LFLFERKTMSAIRIIATIYIGILMLTTFILGFICQAIALVFTYPFISARSRNVLLGTIFRAVSSLMVYANPFWKLIKVGDWSKFKPGRNLIMVNHLSNADPFLTCTALLPFDSKYIAKASLFKIPFGGWAMSLAGDIPIFFTAEKEGWGTKKGSVGEMMVYCKELLRDRIPITVYPEGARSKTGEMQPFKDGFFKLAVDTQTDIIPIALSGSETCWPVGDWRMNFASVYMTVGEAISPGDDPVALRDRVRARIAEMKAEVDSKYPTAWAKRNAKKSKGN